MGIMLWGFCGLLFCGLLFPNDLVEQKCQFSSIGEDGGIEVEEGRLFTVEKRVLLPEEAYPALKVYIKTLFFSRPLPWPYHLEKFDVRDGKVVLHGRVLSPGTYEIPLGMLWWNGKAYSLPRFLCTGTSVHIPLLTVADLLLPFPEKALFPSPQNVLMEDTLLKQNQVEGVQVFDWRELWRHVFVIACLFLVCAPCALQIWRWRQAKKKPEGDSFIVTPSMAFREVKDLQRRGEAPWSKLVYVLNLVGSAQMPSLTSYELEQHFAASGEKELAEASSCIENYGYRSDGGQYFDQTVQLVEKGLVSYWAKTNARSSRLS
jgi:hypothetical protein